jgi:hypothetical protein
MSAGALEAHTRRALATNQWRSIMVTGFNGAARRLHKGIYTALRSCVSFFLFILSDLSLGISFYLPTKSRVLRKCSPSLFRVRVHCFNMRVYQGASSFVSRVRHGHCQGQQNASLLCNRTS